MRRLRDRIIHEERGAVVLLAAAFVPVAVVVAAFVIDIADGMEHRRQLQLQADAGALAASQEFLPGCRTDATAANAEIKRVAEEYATDMNSLFPGTDAQDRLTFEVNNDPCKDRFVRVKLTESDSPDFFSQDTDEYSAAATVEIQKLDQLDDMLPLGIPVPDPKSAAAIFVNETNGAVLTTAALKSAAAEDGLSIWATENPVTVSIPSEHVGVRIALSGGSSTTCGTTVPCYDAVETTKGLAHIRGWTTAGTVTQNASKGLTSPAIIRSVALEPATPACNDGRFLPSFSPATPTCVAANRKMAIAAVIDFGGNPSVAQGKVFASVDGGSETEIFPDASSPWTFRGAVSVPSGEGPIGIDIRWEALKGELPTDNPKKPDVCEAGKKNPCTGTQLDVQRHFRTQGTRSGPIELLQVSEPNVSEHANSLQQGQHALDVKIGIGGTLALAEPDDPPIVLRVKDGSQTGLLRCNPPGNDLDTEIKLGCNRAYAVNTGTPCTGNTPPAVPIPWQCVQIAPTSARDNPTSKALNFRILGHENPGTCPSPGARGHNNWDIDSDGATDYKAGDPRIVHLFLTRFGAFEEDGLDLTPVTGFAAFYITGWDGQGVSANPCQGNGDDPVADDGEIVGHYIPDIKLPNDGGGGQLCDFEAIPPCTPVLVE